VLLSLVESLLSLSKFDGQQGRLPNELIDLREILGDAVFTVTPALSATKSRIIIDPSISVKVRGDKGQLNQIFINLLANAIKFSDDDKEIRISMAMIGLDKIEVSVADHGIGIAHEDIPRIFTRFFRAENVQSGGFEGFGLGLAIVQQAVEHHGGSISVDSRLGEGSIFRVIFPIAHAGDLK
jgi:signal transduction histidine kinase